MSQFRRTAIVLRLSSGRSSCWIGEGHELSENFFDKVLRCKDENRARERVHSWSPDT
jgi:hypothetical protein